MSNIPSAQEPGTPTAQVGFGYSKRRVWAEIALVVGVLAGLVALVIWLAGVLAAALVPYITTKVDVEIGKQSWKSPMFALERCSNPEPLNYVRAVSAPLLEALGKTDYAFEFQVLNNPQVNAFALPGGYITVNIGLLENAETGAEVAAVIAHEIQHVLERHGTRRILRRMGGYAVMSMIFGGTDIQYPAYLLGELGALTYDRSEETESDVQGLALLQRANIDPRGMGTFFKRLQESASVTPPAIISTHPDPGDRAARAEAAAAGKSGWRELPAPKGLSCD